MSCVTIFDSTLRDGAQSTGISFSLPDKLRVVKLLDKLGVACIEGGNPFSNPKEMAFFEQVKLLPLQHAKIAAFGSTRRKEILPRADGNLNALLAADTPVCVIFGKSWKLHVEKVLETTPEENLRMIEDSCRFLKEHGREVVYDAEHFFDGYRGDVHYAMETLYAAVRGGADVICLCDTNGGTFPQETAPVVAAVKQKLQKPLGVHFHDDCGLAVANSIAGINAGAIQVQGTFLGFGERCGNANLSAVIPNLQLKLGYSCIPRDELPSLTQTARAIAAVANISLSGNMPYVGENAFAHKAGMHAGAVLKEQRSFEHIPPSAVGNHRRFPTSEISGKTVMMQKIAEILPALQVTREICAEILDRVKELEHRGYQFEGADASFELLVRKMIQRTAPFFQLLYYNIYTSYAQSGYSGASAVVKVQVGDKVQLMAAEGNGPVNALDAALRKALEVFFPVLSKAKLTDYKVRVLDSGSATASRVCVLITSAIDGDSYTTVGVSEDVVAASWKALEDSMEYLLIRAQE